MNIENITFRKATKHDIAFMSQILVDAGAASGVYISLDELSAYPDTNQYIEGFPQKQDVGIIAETESKQLIGAVWIRLLPTDAHAVEYPIPELTMEVTSLLDSLTYL